ncbi:hypothetical protein OIU76_017163 [Salix suchowensis]|nr:hypothetical protein OIU76_017163 [Salix suchowensis]
MWGFRVPFLSSFRVEFRCKSVLDLNEKLNVFNDLS